MINPGAGILQEDQRFRPEKSEVQRLFGSNEKLKKLTGWEQKYSLKEGLAETVEWFGNPDNLKSYKPRRYNV